MKLGLTLPQGCDREYLGVDPATAWRRTVEVARWAEDTGFDSLWVYDHMQVDPPPEEAPIFEPFAELAALAVETRRARLGHLVLAASYRNAGLTAKAISTIDVISGGRAILGIGAGWKEDEWLAYGYGFPSTNERLAQLGDHLEVISRMLGDGRATYEGELASVRGAINEPKGIQPRIPIIVGGNGPNVTMRLAARFADELNLVYRPPDEIPGLLATARQRCEEIDRDPSTLRMSMYVADDEVKEPGQKRVDVIGRLMGMGLDRLVAFPTRYGATREVQERFAEDCRSAGLVLETRQPATVQ
jgi:alkanesulfonate monooxygenase SsuD/methylene tetrahydromethanopterin reductase-like flavin-dependent oxidoreductase (luciferase family)